MGRVMRIAAAGLAAAGCAGCAVGAPARAVQTPIAPEGERPTPSARSDRASAAPPAAAACADDMVHVSTFCVDRYEAPNEAGRLPLTMQTAQEGEAFCATRGKRLCTESEWTRACEGPDGRRFPYGDEHRASACNDDRTWRPVDWRALARWPDPAALAEAERLFQGEASGSRPGCVSSEGVYDLTGNVAEWARKSEPDDRPEYEHVLKGCFWAGCYHEPHPNCVFRNHAHPGSFRTYEAGFRCCADAASAAGAASGEAPAPTR
jgi:formylglycine-generating enzyme required for sulfatase activity